MDESNIALCPFKGCKGCDRKVEVVKVFKCNSAVLNGLLGKWFVTSKHKKMDCILKTDLFNTPEEAIDSWNRMVGE